MKNHGKRLLSFLLAMLMMLGMFTGIVLPASAETTAAAYADAAEGDLLYTLNFNYDTVFTSASSGITAEERTVSGDNGERVTLSNKAADSDFLSGRMVNYRVNGNVYTFSYYVENSDWSTIRAAVQFLQHNAYRIGFENAKEDQWKLSLGTNEYAELASSVVAATDAENNNRRYFKTVIDGKHGLMLFYVLGETGTYECLGQVDVDEKDLLYYDDYLRFTLAVPDAISAEQAVSVGDVKLYKGNTATEKTAHQTAYDTAKDGDVLYDVDFNDVIGGSDEWETFMPAENAEGISVSDDGKTLTLNNTYGAKQYVAGALRDKTAAHYGSMTYEFYLESNNRMGTWFMGNNAGGNADYREGFAYFSEDKPELNFMVKNDWFDLSEYNAGGNGYIDRNIYRGAAVTETQFGADSGYLGNPDTGADITCNVKVEFDALNRKMTTYILKNGTFQRVASLYYVGTSFAPMFGVYTYYNGTQVTVRDLVIRKGLAASADGRGISVERMPCRNHRETYLYPTENYYSDALYFDSLPRTFGAWVKLDEKGYNALNEAFALHGTAGNNVALTFTAGVPTIAYGNASWTVSDVKALVDTWTHFAFTYDEQNNVINCYVNGALASTYTGETPLSSAELNREPAYIYLMGDDGSDHMFNRFGMSGALGDVFLYDDIRTQAELAADMIAADTTDEELTAYYKLFDAEEGKDVVDHSGNGYNVACGKTWLTEEEMEVKRAADPNEYAYSIALLPDTQKLLPFSSHYAKVFDWLLANREEKNIQFVLNMGDMTDDSTTSEWALVKAQHDRLNDIIPYNVMQGNHDSTATINATFADKEGYYYQSVAANGGFYDEDSVVNTYQLFTVGETDYIILNLGYTNTADARAWGSEILEKYADRRAIIVSHHVLTGKYVQNSALWQMAKEHPNVVLMVGGHNFTDRVAHRVDVGDHGNVIHQLLVNFQSTDAQMDGLGAIGMLYFTEDGEGVAMETYAAVQEEYYRAQNQFTFSYDCYDAPADGDHKCDACGAENLTLCADAEKDHACDVDAKCDVYATGEFAHADTDADHFCEYCGNGVKSSACTDVAGDGDHRCDVCSAGGITTCSDTDGDGDHKCNECGETYYYSYIPDFGNVAPTATKIGYVGGVLYDGHTGEGYFGRDTHKPTMKNHRYEMNYWVKTDNGNRIILSFIKGYCNGAGTRLGWEVGKDLTSMHFVANTSQKADITTPTRDVVNGKQYFRTVFDGTVGTAGTMSLYVLSGGEYVLVDTRVLDSYTGIVTAPYLRTGELTADEILEIGGIAVTETCVDKAGDGDHKCDECGADGASVCTDATGDGDHKCDECGAEGITLCADAADDTDHLCDDCGVAVKGADCTDADGDGDHKCDVCGADGITDCYDVDGDGDHWCEECGLGYKDYACTDVAGDGDHKCDICGADEITACADTDGDGDHKCDECGETYFFTYVPDFSNVEATETQIGYNGGVLFDGHTASGYLGRDVHTPTMKNHRYTMDYWVKTDGNRIILSFINGTYGTYTTSSRLGWEVDSSLTSMYFVRKTTQLAQINTPTRDVVNGKQYFRTVFDGTDGTMSLYVLSGGQYVLVDTRILSSYKGIVTAPNLREGELTADESLELGGISVTETCVDRAGDGDHKCDECGADGASVCTDANGDHKCDECGVELKDLHTEGVKVIADCGKIGIGHTECTVCGITMTENLKVAPTGEHVYGEGVVTPPTVTEQGYTTYTCVGCGESYVSDYTDATGKVAIGETRFATPEEALKAAESGDVVQLLGDVSAEELMVKNGVTLDLNGKVLAAEYLVAFNGASVVDSTETGTGKLAIAKENLALSKNNPQLPVYDEENGCYLFTRVKNDRFELESEGNSPKYSTSPMLKDYVHSLMDTEAKAAASGVDVIIRLTWTDSDGQYVGTQDYTYLDSSIAEVMASYVNENGEVNYAKQFYGIFVGSEIESGVNVSVSTIVRSSAGVEMESAATALFTAE